MAPFGLAIGKRSLRTWMPRASVIHLDANGNVTSRQASAFSRYEAYVRIVADGPRQRAADLRRTSVERSQMSVVAQAECQWNVLWLPATDRDAHAAAHSC
jgi:hypothetical protein